MSEILANSKAEKEEIDSLLRKSVPTYRQAYSDRTAWIMSCVSELAYVKFNPLFTNAELKSFFIEKVNQLIDENKKMSLVKLIDLVNYDHEEERKKLESELGVLNLSLINTFDKGGTQAILVSFDKFIVLAFRGTETTDVKDIKADARAKATACETGGRIHTGFKEAFDLVRHDIEKSLNSEKCKGRPLFVTGHSLGGALATVAAKKIDHQGGLAACYTFGAPRVGDENWVGTIKTPIYRVVNAADCVTMMPPGDEIISVLGFLIGWVPYIGKPIKEYLMTNFHGYLHGGSMRYLTNCPSGQFEHVKLLPSISLFYRMKGLFIKRVPWKHLLSDHSISIYRKKLMMVAQRRN